MMGRNLLGQKYTIERAIKTEKVNDNLNLSVSMANLDRIIVSCNSYPLVQEHRLQNPKDAILSITLEDLKC